MVETVDKEKIFLEAPDESWWHCQTCHKAYQKDEVQTPGVCPHCDEVGYNHLIWDSARQENPQFPPTPVSGQIYAQTVV
jgi:hypothetical protein